MKPTRPIIRYHGGKWKLADWIISNFAEHKVYVEPYGGGGSVLLKKQRAYAEIYNDLDGEVVNLFKVARDNGEALIRALELTPFAKDEFIEAWHPTDDSLEQARRTVVRAFMGFGSSSVTSGRNVSGKANVPSSGFRSDSTRAGTIPAHDWASYPKHLSAIIKRLQGIVIENRDAIEVMKQHDSEKTLHYVDPPYVSTTRDKGSDYVYEMSEQDHVNLAEFLHTLKGHVVLSGYRCDLYDQLYQKWTRVDRKAFADGASPRVESLWVSHELNQKEIHFK